MSDEFRCVRCGRGHPVTRYAIRCACGGCLEAADVPGLLPADVERGEPSLWRYARGLAWVARPPRAYFGEGLTPLVARPWTGLEVAFKLDFLFPSGSFKDRGSAVLANYVATLGADRVHEDSSGNAGASLAAYAAAAGLRCRIFVPAHASPAKLRQIEAHGAEVVAIPGTRAQVQEAAAAYDEDGSLYVSHNWHPLFIEGVKTLAYELWEQMRWNAPEAVVVPAGYGSALLGLWRGFRALRQRGAIARVPRLFAAQAANCAALCHALARPGRQDPDAPFTPRETMAEGIACAAPVHLQEMITAVRDSGGAAVPVPEEAILPAQRDLARLGIFVEPTSAVAAAAVRSLAQAGQLPKSATTVVVLTGSGLKAAGG